MTAKVEAVAPYEKPHAEEGRLEAGKVPLPTPRQAAPAAVTPFGTARAVGDVTQVLEEPLRPRFPAPPAPPVEAARVDEPPRVAQHVPLLRRVAAARAAMTAPRSAVEGVATARVPQTLRKAGASTRRVVTAGVPTHAAPRVAVLRAPPPTPQARRALAPLVA